MSKPKAIIFDVDGTLCDVTDIRHWVDRDDPNFGGRVDFNRFHSESFYCPPHQHVADAFHAAKREGVLVIVATGRSEEWRWLTRQWLIKHDLFPTHQMHRPSKDFRKDVVVKQEMLEGLLHHYDIIEAWDDNPHVIPMWQSFGIKTNVVPGWPVRDGEAVAATSEKVGA
ncbi:phosphatase domain-containing protein [Glutamicibacter arilaitensis]|uniref:phosphatase domain-containing protein n=1 Tax=Glutamicibacter arilaitensis TaxID=256701 RepID=UPI003F8F4102